MKTNLKISLILIITVVVLISTTLLLDFQFFKARLVREIIVYVVMLIEVFISVRLIQITIFQKNPKNHLN